MTRAEKRAFLDGVLCALGCVSLFNEGVIYEEIVRTCATPRELINEARRNESEFDLEHLLKIYTIKGTLRK